MKKSTKNIISGLIGIIAIIVIAIAIGSMNHSAPVTTNNSVVPGAASLTVVAPSGTTVDVGQLEHVIWTAFDYKPSTVTISVIRKVSDNPARYELVRTVAASTAADGSAVWVPAPTDVGSDTIVQVGCATSDQACTAGISAAPLAVINDGRYANTAAIYQSIEASQNK